MRGLGLIRAPLSGPLAAADHREQVTMAMLDQLPADAHPNKAIANQNRGAATEENQGDKGNRVVRRGWPSG